MKNWSRKEMLTFAKRYFCSLFLSSQGNERKEEVVMRESPYVYGQLALSNSSLNFTLACGSHIDLCLGEVVGRRPLSLFLSSSSNSVEKEMNWPMHRKWLCSYTTYNIQYQLNAKNGVGILLKKRNSYCNLMNPINIRQTIISLFHIYILNVSSH